MVATKKMQNKIASVARDVLFAPVYLYQGHKIKRDTVRLPEPGVIEVFQPHSPTGDTCGRNDDGALFDLD